MDILCDMPITICTEETLLQRLTQVPESLTEYCCNVANSFGRLIQSFGTPDYIIKMRELGTSLASNVKLNKKQFITLLTVFSEELSLELQRLYGNEDAYPVLYALKVLFLNPNLRCVLNPKTYIEKEITEWDLCRCGDNEDDTKLVMITNEINAIKIQSHIRQYLTKNLLKYHDEKYPKHNKLVDSLRQIYYDVFNLEKRYVVLKKILLRVFHLNENMNDIKELIPLYKDLENYAELITFNGTLNVLQNNWYLIVKCLIHVKHSKELKISIRCFVNHGFSYTVKVINNDTLEEMDFLINNVPSANYKTNINGYTVLVYGNATITETIDWKLYIGHVKMTDSPLIDVTHIYPLYSERITFTYSPNFYDNICR